MSTVDLATPESKRAAKYLAEQIMGWTAQDYSAPRQAYSLYKAVLCAPECDEDADGNGGTPDEVLAFLDALRFEIMNLNGGRAPA